MIKTSILYPNVEDSGKPGPGEAPAFFVDLNLDQIVNSITISKQEYDLKPIFYTPVNDIDTVHFRHEVMQDLENPGLSKIIRTFARAIRSMHEHLVQADKMYYPYQKKAWFLDAVELYTDAVICLEDDLSQANLKSRGLAAFRDFLTEYIHSDRFTMLRSEVETIKNDLATVTYSLQIKGSTIKVRKYGFEPDYSAEVLKTFDKFKQGAVKDYLVEFHDGNSMNHVEAKILEMVAGLYPEIFHHLDRFSTEYQDYLDETIAAFDREIQFYVSYLDYITVPQQTGLRFCYPMIANPSKEIADREGFDLALAHKLISEKSTVVCNDFYLKDSERIVVVSGPNQGGKTTFARTFGQLHYLASLGLPVPGREAKLYLFDQLFTHFEKEETITNLRGKLEDDLLRIEAILAQATPQSIIILNEIFTSTTLNDAVFLSRKILDTIIELDLLCVCVTFIDELASLPKTVSMVSTVVADNPTERTFKILRKPADGLAYAISIAEKYHLTYQSLSERMNHESISSVSQP